MTDPIADTITRIRNAVMTQNKACEILASSFNSRLLELLKDEGYLGDISRDEQNPRVLKVNLLSDKIHGLKRLSKPGRRLYVGHKHIPTSLSGYGTIIVSTPKGLLTGKSARQQHLGGELIVEIN